MVVDGIKQVLSNVEETIYERIAGISFATKLDARLRDAAGGRV